MTSDELPCGFFALDSRRRFCDLNEEACQFFGHSREELLDQSLQGFLVAGSRIFFQTHIYPLLNMGQRVHEAYVTLLTRQGPAAVLINALPSKSETSRKDIFVFLAVKRRSLFERHLIDAKRAAESAVKESQTVQSKLQTLQEHLTVQDRLAALGTLAAGVAHELNNPLTYVTGNLQMLKDELEARLELSQLEDAQEMLRDTLEGLERIRAIVAGLRAVSRVDKADQGIIDVNQVLRITSKLVEGELRGRSVLIVTPSSEPAYIEADAGKLSQVLINLLVNANQALQQASTPQPTIRLTVELSPVMVDIIVEDNGPGIPSDLRLKICDPFFTTKPVGQGTGLGLYISYSIVQALDGYLTHEERKGPGTRFRVSLPRCNPTRPPHSSSPPAPREILARARLRILIADDDERVAKILALLLKKYDVEVVNSGSEALARLDAGMRYDLFLCDLMMPEMSGMEVYERLRASYPEMESRFAIITGGAFSTEAQKFLEQLGDRVIWKPFDALELRKIILRLTESSP